MLRLEQKSEEKALTDPKMGLGWNFLLITRPIFTMHELNTTWFNFSFHTSEYPNKGINCWNNARAINPRPAISNINPINTCPKPVSIAEQPRFSRLRPNSSSTIARLVEMDLKWAD